MYWVDLTEQMLIDSNNTGNNTFEWSTDIDSIIIVTTRADAFKARRGVVQISCDPPYHALPCQNTKMISHLSNSYINYCSNEDFVEVGDGNDDDYDDFVTDGATTSSRRAVKRPKITTTSPRHRFFEFVLCGTGDDRIFVLVEVVPELAVFRQEEEKRLNKMHLSYIKNVVIPSVKDLSNKGETHLTFGDQQVPLINDKGSRFKINIHSTDWENFCINLNHYGLIWKRICNVENIYFYNAAHGRRFKIDEASEYLNYVCDTGKQRLQIFSQIHLAETIAPPTGAACFINLQNFKKHKNNFCLRHETLNFYRPYGLINNTGHFSSYVDNFNGQFFEPLNAFAKYVQIEKDKRLHQENDDNTDNSGGSSDDGDNLMYNGYTASYIQAYDPLVHVLRKRFDLTHSIAPAFLLGLFSKRAEQSEYIQLVATLRDQAKTDLQNWKCFVGTTCKSGSRLRIEVVLNFMSTTDESFLSLIQNLKKYQEQKKISPILNFFCKKQLITVCLNGWRDHIISTAGSCLDILIKEWADKIDADDDGVRESFHGNEEGSYFSGVEFDAGISDRANEGGDDNGDNDFRRYHIVFAECFQFVYDAEIRLLQLALGTNKNRNNFDNLRWKLHYDKNSFFNYAIRRSEHGEQCVSFVKFRPLNKMPLLTRCPTEIFPPQLRLLAQWIWCTLPKIGSSYELREMNKFMYYRWQVERLIMCLGLRYWSNVGSRLPREAETAFARTRIDDHVSKKNFTICGCVSPETVANWIIFNLEHDEECTEMEVGNSNKKSISEILKDVVIPQAIDDDFKNILINYVREFVAIFPDLSFIGGEESTNKLSFRYWRFVVINSDEENIWSSVLNILKFNFKIPPKYLKKLPSNVCKNWQLEIIEVLKAKIGERYKNSVTALVAITIAINVMGNIPTSARNVNFLEWNRFVAKENLPMFLLKKLGFVKTPGNVFENMGSVSENWQRTFSLRYEQRITLESEEGILDPSPSLQEGEPPILSTNNEQQQLQQTQPTPRLASEEETKTSRQSTALQLLQSDPPTRQFIPTTMQSVIVPSTSQLTQQTTPGTNASTSSSSSLPSGFPQKKRPLTKDLRTYIHNQLVKCAKTSKK